MARSVWSDASLGSDMWPYATPPEEESAETEEAAPTLDGDAAVATLTVRCGDTYCKFSK